MDDPQNWRSASPGALRNDHQSSNLFLRYAELPVLPFPGSRYTGYAYDVPEKSGSGLDVDVLNTSSNIVELSH